MSRTLFGVVLLLLVCGAFAIPTYRTICTGRGGEGEGSTLGGGVGVGDAGTDIPDIYRTGPISVDTAFQLAWQMRNPYSPGCGHLATYETQEEYDAIVQSMIDAGAAASLIGARRDPGQQIYYWAAGGLRGRNYLFVEDTFANCFQDFCLPDESEPLDDVLPITQDEQNGINLVVYYIGGVLTTELSPTDGAECYTIEYPEVAVVADSRVLIGTTPFPPSFYLYEEPLPYFQMEEALIKQGHFIARVYDATQNQWIQDEFQCAHFNIWLGYYAQEDVLRCASGPDDGTIIAATGDQTCDVYCNFPAPQRFEEDESVYMDSRTGVWGMRSRSARYWALSQEEVCPPNPQGFTAVCTNSTSDSWYELLPSTQADSQLESGHSFLPGGPFFFNIDYDEYALYFDCSCKTDYRVRLPCLGSPDISTCELIGTSDVSSENSSFSTHSSLDNTSEDVPV